LPIDRASAPIETVDNFPGASCRETHRLSGGLWKSRRTCWRDWIFRSSSLTWHDWNCEHYRPDTFVSSRQVTGIRPSRPFLSTNPKGSVWISRLVCSRFTRPLTKRQGRMKWTGFLSPTKSLAINIW
jgi:hypothetical protein